MDGGFPRLPRILLNHFSGYCGRDIQVAGVRLPLRDGTAVRIYANLAVLLGDEPAIKEVLSCKGHAGTKPCVFCLDCVQHRTPQGALGLHSRSDYAKSMAHHTLEGFRMHTDDSIKTMVKPLHDAHPPATSKGDYAKLQTLYGWTYNPYNVVLADRMPISVVSMVMFDWAHIMVCDGIADTELGQLFALLHKSKAATTLAELGNYVQKWCLPKHLPSVTRLFSPSLNKNNVGKAHFQCSASEFLTLAPILKRYLEKILVPRAECKAAAASMLASLYLLELLVNVRRNTVTPEQLTVAAAVHFISFRTAHGDDQVRPKHHYSLHLGELLHRHGALHACLVNERRHRVVKRYSLRRCNLLNWEKGVLEEVTCHQLGEMEAGFLAGGPKPRSKPSARLLYALAEIFPDEPDLMVSANCHASDGQVSVGDIVLFVDAGKQSIGELCTMVHKAASMLAICTCWSITGRSGSTAQCICTDDAVLIPFESVACSLTYYMSEDRGSASVLLPREYRGAP